MQKLTGESMDIIRDNIDKLKTIFPDVFTEGSQIDFDALRSVLGDYVDEGEERYSFTWNGKGKARRIAQTPSLGTLRPCKGDSKNWDTTQNLYIEGDNLEVLKLLQKSYYGKVKMIYIDPPYNTGKDFVYKDDFRDNIKNYLELTGQTDEQGKRLSTNAETSGRYHTDWLNMMYPRLKLARNLLRDDGAICVSIASEEIQNILWIMNEIFGDDNFRNSISVRRYDKNLSRQFMENGLVSLAVGYEYVLIYSKKNDFFMNPVFREASEERQSFGYWKGFWNSPDRPTMRYECLGVKPTFGQWKWREDIARDAVNNYQEYLKAFADEMTIEEYWEKTGKSKRFIRRKNDGKGKNFGVEHWIPPSTGILRTSNWTDILASESLANLSIPFDSPKNSTLLNTLICLCCDDDSVVLDFFSGSATTAHATMQLNAEDGGKRKFIMVQLPEPCDENSEAFKAGYKNICEIGKERIRRAGEKIIKELREKNAQLKLGEESVDPDKLDVGFKVFKLDSSNIARWDPDFNNLEQSLFAAVDNIKSGRSSEDVLYEVLLKLGLDLTLPIEEKRLLGKTVYSVGCGALIVCLDSELPVEMGDAIGKLKEQLAPEVCRVLFKDSSFVDDVAKTNIVQTLKRYGVEDVRSL